MPAEADGKTPAAVAKPAVSPEVKAAAKKIDLNNEGAEKRNGIIRDTYPGVLRVPPKVRARPFEIILETPQEPPSALKEAALVAALRMILTRYRDKRWSYARREVDFVSGSLRTSQPDPSATFIRQKITMAPTSPPPNRR